MGRIPRIGPVEVMILGQECFILLTSHVFGNKEKLLIWAYCWLFGGSDGVALGCPGLQMDGIPPLGPDEVD